MPITVQSPIANNDSMAFAVVRYFTDSLPASQNTHNYDNYRVEVMESTPFVEVTVPADIRTPTEVTLPGDIGAHHIGYVRVYEIETPLQQVALQFDHRSSVIPLEIGAPGYDAAANGIQVQFRAVLTSQAQVYPLLPPTVAP